MRVLVVSEGKHELNLDGETSALVELLRRMLPVEAEFERRRVSDRVVQQVAFRGKALRHEKRLLLWMRYAERQGFSGLTLIVDEDGIEDRRSAVQNAQESAACTIPRAIGLAIKKFDASMLADEVALSGILGPTVQRQPDPETIRDPKAECLKLLADAGDPMSMTDMYLAVARTADLEGLSKRCPKGFAPFRESVRLLKLTRE